MEVTHIIFDLGNVLIDIHPERAMAALAETCNLPVARVQQLFLSSLHLQFMSGRLTGPQFYRRVRDALQRPVSLPRFRRVWGLVIGEPKDGMPELVKQLHERGYRLSLCSNTDPWHWQLARARCPFFKWFHRIFLSYRMRRLKPDRQVFEQVLAELHCLPGEAVFVDDTAENVSAARAVGMSAIHAWDVHTVAQGLAELGIAL